MLEISHLTKIYKNKNGANVKALDDISLTFPETGMVFLLGKSGSGKSTLLNVCGGLDSPTSGEIIVKGRSSKSFTESDFDSYRNTFIGFIFQEYNILNEFTVEENISLALELQGKPSDKKAIEELLEKVDLTGFAKRKPNTLSGGQKQRIAIARALIKNPEIIMADEPTGALDSLTGKQVLDTLKRLSKDTLVIVVSHDREFAENYADRIIELKDGKVIRDEIKKKQNADELTNNVSVVGNVLCIKNGSNLSDSDFKSIKNFIAKTNEEVIIANEKEEVDNFKKISRINSNGAKEVFEITTKEDIKLKSYSEADSQFIKSKLPQKHAFRIGLSGMKAKPIRLIFTVLLCTVAFVFFGILSTMTFYSSESTFKKSLDDNNIDVIQLTKSYPMKEKIYFEGEFSGEFESLNRARFSNDELIDIRKEYGEESFGAIYIDSTINIKKSTNDYWVNSVEKFAVVNDDNKILKNIIGNPPTKDNEIVLSSYLVDVIMNNSAYDSKGNVIEINKHEDIINKSIVLGSKVYNIVGVFDSGEIDSKYDILKEGNQLDARLKVEYNTMLSDSLHLVAFINEDSIGDLSQEVYTTFFYTPFDYHEMAAKGPEGIYQEYSSYSYQTIDVIDDQDNIVWFNDNKKLEGQEVLVETKLLATLMREHIQKKRDYTMSAQDRKYAALEEGIAYLENGVKFDHNGQQIKVSREQEKKYLQELINEAKNINLQFDAKLFSQDTAESFGEEYQFKVVGTWNSTLYNNYGNKMFIVSDSLNKSMWDIQRANLSYYSEYETEYVSKEDEVYDIIYLAYDGSNEQKDVFYKLYINEEANEEHIIHSVSGVFIDNLHFVDDMVEVLSIVFLVAGIVLAVFAILLFSNFIAISISQKQKDIGILRAVGAKGSDIFKIFFSESLTIALICLVAAIGFTLIGSKIINILLAELIPATIFVVGVPTIAILVLIAVATAILATFLPVYKAAKKKPVDCIRG